MAAVSSCLTLSQAAYGPSSSCRRFTSVPSSQSPSAAISVSAFRTGSRPLRTAGRVAQRGQSKQGHAGRSLVVRALEVSGPGAIDSPLMFAMKEKIQAALEADHVTVKDAYGDGRHVSIEVVSALFEGKRSVERQRMVYKTIWEELASTVHAVDSLTTKTPAENSGTA